MNEPADPSNVDTLAAGAATSVATGTVTVYWRPGCGFCAALRFGLERAGVGYEAVNIWEVPAAAEFVRSVAGGSETVPTVTVDGPGGTTSMVNPSVTEVVAAL